MTQKATQTWQTGVQKSSHTSKAFITQASNLNSYHTWRTQSQIRSLAPTLTRPRCGEKTAKLTRSGHNSLSANHSIFKSFSTPFELLAAFLGMVTSEYFTDELLLLPFSLVVLLSVTILVKTSFLNTHFCLLFFRR